jgi:hypothetical protein
MEEHVLLGKSWTSGKNSFHQEKQVLQRKTGTKDNEKSTSGKKDSKGKIGTSVKYMLFPEVPSFPEVSVIRFILLVWCHVCHQV